MAATQDLFHNLTTVAGLNPQNVASDTTTNGSQVDTNNAMSVMGVLVVGNYTSGTFELEVEESDDGNNWSTVDDSDLHGTAGATTLGQAGIAKVGYHGGMRYVRFNVVSANGADADVSVVALKGHLYHAPDSDQVVS